MRCLAFLLAVAAAAAAGPGKTAIRDEMHPRAPGTPLEIKFAPWRAVTMTRKGLVDPMTGEPAEPWQMMRMPLPALAKELDVGPGWVAIETPNFKIFSTLEKSRVLLKDSVFARADLERLKTIFPKLVIGRKAAYLDPHQRAHLYHIRVERIYTHFAALTATKKKWLGMEERYHLFLFDGYAPHHVLNDRFTGRVNDKAGVQHHMREKPNFMLFTTSEQQVARDKGKGEAIFNNHVVHNVAHNLMDGHNNYYRETPGWIEEGIGHYYERRENPRHNTFCWSEGKPPRSFLKPDWESVIYSLVRRGKDTALNRWCEKLQPGQLTGIENGMSWSIVRWIVETEPIRFTKMINMIDDTKGKPDSAQCIEAAFGVSPSVLHQRWREYVLENYGRR